jgi:integrase
MAQRRATGERLKLLEHEYGIKVPDGFTDRWCERGAKIVPFAYVVYDAKQTGLGLRVAPNGKKTWVVQTIFPGYSSQARRVLGHYPAMGLKAAREEAAKWLSLVKNGTDPAQLRAEQRRAGEEARRQKALADSATFASFAEKYISERTNRRRATDAQEIRRMLIAEWGERPLYTITGDDVREHIKTLVRHAPYDAKNAWLHASAIFKAAMEEKLIVVSPCAAVNKKKLFPKGTIKPRQRFLKPEELRAFWSGTEQLGQPYSDLFRLLLLTGMRLNELAKARWSELDPALRKTLRDVRAGAAIDWQTVKDEIKTLTVPRERFKSDREHVVQLSHDALAIIVKLPRCSGGDFIFSTTLGTKPINGLSKAKRRLDALMVQYLRGAAVLRDEDPEQVKIEPWVCHDLRRTVRTNLAGLKVPFEVAESILGHTLGGLHATYNVHGYDSEVRAALEEWAAKLGEIITSPPSAPMSDNVTNLAERRKARAS